MYKQEPFIQKGVFKNLYIVLCFLLLPTFLLAGNNTQVLLDSVELALEKRDDYQNQKFQKIHYLSNELQTAKRTLNKRLEYDLTQRLYQEYQSFVYDSAFKYVRELISVARELKDDEIINQSKIELSFISLSSGLFKESLDTLKGINSESLNPETKIEYYKVLARTYYDLGDYHNDKVYSNIYTRLGNHSIDTAISLLSDTTAAYWLALGLKQMKSNDMLNAVDAFNYVMSRYSISDHDYAISASSLGWIYDLLGRNNDAIDMLAKAAIADIQSSTKETVALRNLAIQLYKEGDLERAYRYLKVALEDATFYNARHRKMEIGEILPIIDSKRIVMLERQRKQLINFVIATTLLSILVTIFLLIIYKQLKRLKVIREILQATNSNLQEMNDTLLENNKIKEEYIGHFFSINSEFIDRLESIQKTIRRKIASRQFNDLADIVTPGDLQKERDKLFVNFDKIFLKLFPNFIEEFNKLFKEEDQIVVDKNELLNADLRIFALIRLGITDSEKIAKFLNYTVNTIYTYKTKLKHKTIVQRDKFDEHIMAIKAL